MWNYSQFHIQGYSQKMRLQRRLYIFFESIFFAFKLPCRPDWHISVLDHFVNHENTQLNAETKNLASNRHIFTVWGRLYSLILCGYLCRPRAGKRWDELWVTWAALGSQASNSLTFLKIQDDIYCAFAMYPYIWDWLYGNHWLGASLLLAVPGGFTSLTWTWIIVF